MTTTRVQEPSLFNWQQVRPSRLSRQKAILDELGVHTDMTNTELAAALHWPINSVTPRINELREAGKVGCRNPRCLNRAHLNAAMDVVHDACKRRCRVTGRDVFAWRTLKN